MRTFIIWAAMVCFLLVVRPYCAWGSPALEVLIDNGGYVVLDGANSLKYREKELFLPASTLKLLTGLIAFEQLGKEYRFETHFFIDQRKNLYIKGFGDPFLTSETILEIARHLAARGVKEIDTLFLDDSSFALNAETAGGEISANPYDAPNGALAVNFNALPVHVDRDSNITSGEPQTPLIGLMLEAGAALPPGSHRINIDTLSQVGPLPSSLRYTGELFIVLLQQAGVQVRQGYARKAVPPGLPPGYVHRNEKALAEIIRACLKYSNNFIANQLFLACGARQFGYPATWEKSRRNSAIFAEQRLHLGPAQLRVLEGSGLSRQNRISPEALVRVLTHFRPYAELLNRQDDVLLKSGTMKDVYCYAGYFTRQRRLLPFAILLNQPANRRDRVLRALLALLTRGNSGPVTGRQPADNRLN